MTSHNHVAFRQILENSKNNNNNKDNKATSKTAFAMHAVKRKDFLFPDPDSEKGPEVEIP